MSFIGMRHIVFAPIATETVGEPIVYGTGLANDHARRADITLGWAEGTLYANDVLDDYYKMCNGADIEMEASQLEPEILELLGLEVSKTGDVRAIRTTADTPVGFGFVVVTREDRTTKYDAYWIHKVTFSPADINAATMEENIEWTSQTFTGKGWTVYLDNGDPQVIDHKTFDTYADAVEWVNDRGHVTSR